MQVYIDTKNHIGNQWFRNIDLLLRKLRRKGFSNLTGNFERKEIIKHDDVYILELTRDKKGGFINNKQQVVFYRK